jgi:hypothetical protein
VVHALYVPTNRTCTLFSVVHRVNAPYPVTIIPKNDDLPNFLRKSYYQPGLGDISAARYGLTGSQIINEWVADSPADFRKNLREAFNLESVRAILVNLAASHSVSIDDEGPENEEFDDESSGKSNDG